MCVITNLITFNVSIERSQARVRREREGGYKNWCRKSGGDNDIAYNLVHHEVYHVVGSGKRGTF